METEDYTRDKLRTFADGEREVIKSSIEKARKLKEEKGAGRNRPAQSLYYQQMKGGLNEMETRIKPKTCQRKYLLCNHVNGDDNAEMKVEIKQWCDACARELEHGHTAN